MNAPVAFLLSAFLLAGVPTVAGCSSQQYDPNYWHQNFVTILKNKIGQKFESVRGKAGWAVTEAFIGSINLSNGNIAYRYRAGGTCRYTFEVDPKTDIIVAASWEGEARHCIIIP
ncbi:MAG TPA: hypothetical protein PLQ95_06450 [Thiobacillus sp.]|nr:hypothetical protein [Thiobacillus sp.]